LSYTVIENFLPKGVEDAIEEQFQYKTQWNYVSFTSGNEEEDKDPNSLECPQLVHQSFWAGEPTDTYALMSLPLNFLEAITGCTVKDIHKIKTNMNIMDPRYEGKYHPPHADHKSSEYFTMIYYIKDSDGSTKFFNKSIKDPFPYRDLKIVGEVHPKKGRAVIFPANLMHTGTCPIKTENRLVTNYVFKADNLKVHFEKSTATTIEHY
tara:strand:+ start:473 stop:1096 length:624 start_codon:yes stop_codon:yes gene_type:complete